MSDFDIAEACDKYDPTNPKNGEKDVYVQLVLSVALGLSAFIGFCVGRSASNL